LEPNQAGLSAAELDVLKVLWEVGPSTVRQVNQRLDARGRRWAYTTVATLLQRLQAKGSVAVDASGSAHLFSASTSRNELLGHRLDALADQLCAGEPAPLLLALVQRGHKFSRDDIARFRRLLDEIEVDGDGPAPG